MTQNDAATTGPDFSAGIELSSIPVDGILAGHVGDDTVLLSRAGDRVFAVSGKCTHYGAPLAEGLVDGQHIRCPWHHARFDLHSGECLAAPAFAALQRWHAELTDGVVHVRKHDETSTNQPSRVDTASHPQRIVIVGAGAAGFAAAQRLRTLGFSGSISLLSADTDAPYDRPNLSKDYLSGSAPADWMPLQSENFYREQRIDLHLNCEVIAIDVNEHQVRTKSSPHRHPYDRLLLATGAEPVRLDLPGFSSLPNVVTLRSMDDARSLIAALSGVRSVAVIGAGFIGLEVTAALRARDLDVHVIARESDPMAKILGPDLAAFIVDLHRKHGVKFHLGCSPAGYDGKLLTLQDGSTVAAELVIVGVGVRPRTQLAEFAALEVDHGVLVNAYMQTSSPEIYAAGDIARYKWNDQWIRVEHWVHAERQGQLAAANMLGLQRPFRDIPFFWTHHYGTNIRYSGHAEAWDEARLDGSVMGKDACVRLFRHGTLCAAVTLGRDLENLEIERQLELAHAAWDSAESVATKT